MTRLAVLIAGVFLLSDALATDTTVSASRLNHLFAEGNRLCDGHIEEEKGPNRFPYVSLAGSPSPRESFLREDLIVTETGVYSLVYDPWPKYFPAVYLFEFGDIRDKVGFPSSPVYLGQVEYRSRAYKSNVLSFVSYKELNSVSATHALRARRIDNTPDWPSYLTKILNRINENVEKSGKNMGRKTESDLYSEVISVNALSWAYTFSNRWTYCSRKSYNGHLLIEHCKEEFKEQYPLEQYRSNHPEFYKKLSDTVASNYDLAFGKDFLARSQGLLSETNRQLIESDILAFLLEKERKERTE